MRLQLNLHRVPTIIPIWVMILFFRQHRYLCHKGKGLTEVFKGKGAAKEAVLCLPVGWRGLLGHISGIHEIATNVIPANAEIYGCDSKGAVF